MATTRRQMTRRQWMRSAAVAAVCAMPGMVDAVQPDKAASQDRPDSPRGKAEGKGQGPKTQKVNLNGASKAELMKLEGVGAGAADRIIAYREAHGPFKRVQDLEKVDKVGKMVLDKNAGRLAVK